jgi:hypothetical protein
LSMIFVLSPSSEIVFLSSKMLAAKLVI